MNCQSLVALPRDHRLAAKKCISPHALNSEQIAKLKAAHAISESIRFPDDFTAPFSPG